MMFKNPFKNNSNKEYLLLNEEKELKCCDLCNNTFFKLKKCEDCYEKKLCKDCLYTKKTCMSCNIKYEQFCKSLQKIA